MDKNDVQPAQGAKRILGLDYGSKRIGVAVSDESRKFAMPVATVKSGEGALAEIVKIAREQGTAEIVIGESRDYAQKANIILEESAAFKFALESAGFAVTFEPEFMTSHQAERTRHELGGVKGKEDASAAAIILQSYLDRQV